MKFFLPLLLMPFLCVKCCPWDDCEGGDFICDEILPVLPELANVIPYENGEILMFRFEESLEDININVFRREGLIGSQQCQDEIFVVVESDDPDHPVRVSLSTDTNGERLLMFDFSFGPLEFDSRERFNIEFDAQGVVGTEEPFELRRVADTILAEINYEDVAIVNVPTAVDSGKISSFYYNETDGLLRVERVNAPAFFRIN